MKIGFDVAQTCVPRAGCAWYADGLARALAAEPSVSLDLYHHFGSWCNESTAGGTSLAGAAASLRGLTAAEAREIWGAAADRGLPGAPALVHSNSFEAPRIAHTRLVYTLYDLSFWSHPAFTTETNRLVCQTGVLDALERASAFAFISRASLGDFRRALPGWLEETARPWAVIPPASRFPPELPLVSESPSRHWLCVGSIEPRKNHQTLLDAYEEYRKLRPHGRDLVIVGGGGWASDAIHERMRALRSLGVRYLGYLRDEELAQVYREAFAVVQPSWHEGFGLPVVEAMNFGLPVMCSDIDSHREAGGDAPLYVRPENAREWLEALVRLDDDPHLARALAEKSVLRQSHHSWAKSAKLAVEFYRLLKHTP